MAGLVHVVTKEITLLLSTLEPEADVNIYSHKIRPLPQIKQTHLLETDKLVEAV